MFTAALFVAAANAADCEYYRKLTGAECADSCVPATLGICPRSLIVKEGGLDAGKCKDIGYTTDKGEQDQKCGPCGTLKFEHYTKSPVGASGEVLVVDFKGTQKAVTHEWRANNDPVMGGQSYSTVNVEHGYLNFTGACKIVPSLKAPGFITAVNSDQHPFVDVSRCAGLKIMHKSTSNYTGYRISFGTKHPIGGKFFARGFKSNFAPSVGEFGTATLPFHGFTDFWNDGTGAAIHTCKENPKYCPDKETLSNMKTLSIWAEGVEGDIELLVESISGYGCTN
jgi:hypothetical protein